MSGTRWIGGLAVVVAAVCVGCSDPGLPEAPTPVDATISDSFTGTLNPFGTNLHKFTVSQIGKVRVTLDTVTPSAAIGLGVGTPSVATGTCLALNSMTAVGGPIVQIAGTATVTGEFCISVSDVGNLVEAVTYTITVVHS